jgi:hypothetical protein
VEGVAVPGETGQRPKEEPQVVADEQTPSTGSEDTPPSGETGLPVTEKAWVAEEGQGSAEPVEGVAVPGETGQRPEKEPQAVADEQAPKTVSEGTPPPGGTEPPVTEKPVATRRKISQYVVSVDEVTGSIVKIEKLDEQTGKPKEFTRAEYTAAYSFASYAAPYYAAYAASLYDPLSSPAVQAYVKGIADYLKAFIPQR